MLRLIKLFQETNSSLIFGEYAGYKIEDVVLKGISSSAVKVVFPQEYMLEGYHPETILSIPEAEKGISSSLMVKDAKIVRIEELLADEGKLRAGPFESFSKSNRRKSSSSLTFEQFLNFILQISEKEWQKTLKDLSGKIVQLEEQTTKVVTVAGERIWLVGDKNRRFLWRKQAGFPDIINGRIFIAGGAQDLDKVIAQNLYQLKRWEEFCNHNNVSKFKEWIAENPEKFKQNFKIFDEQANKFVDRLLPQFEGDIELALRTLKVFEWNFERTFRFATQLLPQFSGDVKLALEALELCDWDIDRALSKPEKEEFLSEEQIPSDKDLINREPHSLFTGIYRKIRSFVIGSLLLISAPHKFVRKYRRLACIMAIGGIAGAFICLLYTSPSPRD